MEKKYEHIDDIAMFNNVPFHPVTKEPMPSTKRLDCSIDTRYETGIIFCKGKSNVGKLVASVVGTIAIVLACLFVFSIRFDVKNLEYHPPIFFILSQPHVFILAFIIAAIIIIIVGRSR